MKSKHLTILVPEATRKRLAQYLAALRSYEASPGARLATCLVGLDLKTLTEPELLDALLNTKLPQIFAESAVAGDGSDWNLIELGLMGDVSVAADVTIFDNGSHTAPVPHAEPFPGTLIFTPGALLRNGRGYPPADWAEVTQPNEGLCREGYFRLYERRLLPVFRHVDSCASARGKQALLTIPGLGCGQFAGPFRGQLGAELQVVLERFLAEHGRAFPNIQVVYFDPFSECANIRREIHGISLLVRPLLRGNSSKPQLCLPAAYAEGGDNFTGCMFFSIVAWDHVSWPGNDFFAGSRCTDDGVKAAATNLMAVITGVEGRYEPRESAYLPPQPFHTWGDVVKEKF